MSDLATTTVLQTAEEGGLAKKTTLPSGLRVITESSSAFRSVSLGLWVGVGSRDEPEKLAGSAHFLEHLLFKGTSKRSAMDISSALDAVGGELNAFTSKEFTCYYARVLDENLPIALDVLTDMFSDPLLREEDVESERKVITEEISMHEDEPSDVAHERFVREMFATDSLGRPVIGTRQTVGSVSQQEIRDFYQSWYRPENTVIVAAGNVDHDDLVAKIVSQFEKVGWLDQAKPAARPRGDSPAAHNLGAVNVVHRPTEQAHIVFGTPGIDHADERRYALGVLNASLGGGMSSRLFQEVREKRGLAYAVYSFAQQFSGSGLFGVYAGTVPSRSGELAQVVKAELADVASSGLTEEEIERGKGQMKGGLVLGLEESSARMTRLGKTELTTGDHRSVSEVLDRIAAVNETDVAELAGDLLAKPLSVTGVGPFESDEVLREAVAA